MLTIFIIIGTRPEAIKLCPIISELKSHVKFNPIVICTGQHTDIVTSVLELFNIVPTLWLNINNNSTNETKLSLSSLTAQILENMENVIKIYNPKLIMIQGDTTSAFTLALCAFYNHIPIAHIEGGLRSFNMLQPYPEEFNRKTISSIASFHFTTTQIAKDNLLKENISDEKCFYVGNTVVDSYKRIINSCFPEKIKKENLILITCHRRENWGEPLKQLCKSICKMCTMYSNYDFIFCSHPNPSILSIVQSELKFTKCKIVNSLSYDKFLEFVLKAKIIITDSGGIQEEACITGIPTLVYRNVTERPEGLGKCLLLVGNNTDLLECEIDKLVNNTDYYSNMNNPLECYGNGNASIKIVSILDKYYSDKEI